MSSDLWFFAFVAFVACVTPGAGVLYTVTSSFKTWEKRGLGGAVGQLHRHHCDVNCFGYRSGCCHSGNSYAFLRTSGRRCADVSLVRVEELEGQAH